MRTLVFGRALAIAVLVATMLAWGTAAAQTVDPPTLELTSSREFCTAGTLTELSWVITGGTPPYTLSIDGETVEANAESHRANCGAIPTDPMGPLPGTTPAKTFRASVTDSQAAPVTATAEVQVELAPPLPAPTNLWLSGLTQEVIYGFDYSVAGAGAQAPEDAGPYERLWQTGYVLRVRATSASAAEPYDIVRVPQFTHVLEWTVPGPHHGMVASMRHPIERHTPSALIWSAPVSFALAETPQNVTVTATHDTVTVSWDEQPHADYNNLSIDGPGYHNDAHVWDLSTSSGTHTYTFERVPPETEFDIHISIGCYADEPEGTSYYTPNAYAFTGARTKAAPSDWTPPPVGPLNLRATATHDEITLTWDRPHPDARPAWRVLVYEGERYFATLAGHSERPVRIRFGMRSYVRPSTTYRVLVTHHGATTGSAEVTVTTAAAPAEGVAPTSYERLIPPVGTTYTFTVTTDERGPSQIMFNLSAARPPLRPGLKPQLGVVVVTTSFEVPPTPLTLELGSSRELCTANTLTELSWTIAGGRPPYTLSIDGQAVDANAESHRANCGPIPADPMGPLPDTTPAKTFRASVTDSQATPVTATDAVQVELAEALPPPTGIDIASLSVVIGVRWTPKPAPAEGVSPPARFLPQGLFLLRHRLLDAASWTYELRADLKFPWWIVLLDEGTRELMFAELRAPIEAETPEALDWSAATRAATHAPPENLTATATHNTVTVTWQRQPDALKTWVFVRLLAQDPYGGSLADFVQETGVTGDASVTFEHLPPDAEFVAKVEYGDDVSASVPVRTTAAPDGYDYAAIPQGAQNLRATLSDTGTRITVTWDDPYPGNENHYDAHLIDVETGRRLDRADIVLAGTNSWSTTGSAAFGRVQLGREYRVNVGHDAIPFTEASILVTTPDLPPSSRAARRAAAQADPLTLELTSSRALCTANTLTELSWTIAGGRPPYTLTIDGETVDANAESHRVNCGPLPTDPFTNDPLPNPTKSFSATVTDSQTTPDSATDDVRVELVPPLPAPQNVQYASYVADVPVRWDPVPGAGAQSPRSIHPDSGTDWQITGVVRTRLLDDRLWSYDVAGFAQGRKTLAPLAGLRVLSVAAVRHPLEVDTPEALNWSAELTYAATTEAQNVVLTVTHDTLTASWDKQPYARDQGIHAILELEATGGERRLQLWEEEGVSGRHEVTIGDLPPETDFTFAIVMVDTSATSGNPFRRAVRTKPAPPGWIPLPTGAQNLRVTSSDDGHTISWDPPSPHSARSWALRVDNVATGRNVFHTFTSGATTWTISRDRLFSSARYRVTVVHFDLNRIETSIEFNTTQSPPVGQIVDPLTLELTSSRELCTANTLTELSWTIAGGRPPYTLTIDGETVDANAESHRANCGPIPTDPFTGDPVANPTKTFNATVTDSSSSPNTTPDTATVTLLDAIAAPTLLGLPLSTSEGVEMDSPTDDWAPDFRTNGRTLLRYRPRGQDAWTNRLTPGEGSIPIKLDSGAYESQLAYLRHPIEAATPDALNWSRTEVIERLLPAQNLSATAMHDSVTVAFDDQRGWWVATVSLLQRDESGKLIGMATESFLSLASRTLDSDTHRLTFSHLPPATMFTVQVRIGNADYPSTHASTTVRTQAAPFDWTPPARGPQNLHAVATHNSITVSWDPPFDGNDIEYHLQVFEAATGRHVSGDFPGASRRQWSVYGGVYERLKPDTGYRVVVTHRGIPFTSAEIIVSTLPTPSPQGTARTRGCGSPLLYRFLPAWLVDSW